MFYDSVVQLPLVLLLVWISSYHWCIGSKDDGSGEEDEVEVPIRDAYKNNDIQQRDEKETEKEEEEDQPATPPVKKTEKKKEKGKTRKGKQPKAAPPPVLAQEEFFGESKVTSVFL